MSNLYRSRMYRTYKELREREMEGEKMWLAISYLLGILVFVYFGGHLLIWLTK